jgi:hypothetical protein
MTDLLLCHPIASVSLTFLAHQYPFAKVGYSSLPVQPAVSVFLLYGVDGLHGTHHLRLHPSERATAQTPMPYSMQGISPGHSYTHVLVH